MDWVHLSSESQLEDIKEKSFQPHISAILVFKHSTRCSISSMAISRLERAWKLPSDSFPVYHLDLLNHRSVSDKIAEKYKIQHQSPQVLIIKNGRI